MKIKKVQLFLITFICLNISLIAQEAASEASVSANTWRKVLTEETGRRNSPAFYYDADSHSIKLTGGSGGFPIHWDNESLDLKTLKFMNEYPEGSDKTYTPASGVTKAPFLPRKGWPQRVWKKDKAGLWRIPWEHSYGASSQTFYQYAFDKKNKRLITYTKNQTFAFDLKTKKWSDTGAGAYSKGKHMEWGSMCYESVNGEILSLGGTSLEKNGTPGSWLFKCSSNKWEKLKLGPPEMVKLNDDVFAAKRLSWSLLSKLRNRFYEVETIKAKESKPSDAGKVLLLKVNDIQKSLLSIKPTIHHKEGLKRAASKVESIIKILELINKRIDTKTDKLLLAAIQKVYDELEKVDRNVDLEPTGRALSKMVFDSVNNVIVLFGGDGLDRHYGDTWVYHCKERVWEQRFPDVSPSPRAGHGLVWLPKSKSIILAGGYGLGNDHSYMWGGIYQHIALETWRYDVTKNKWINLLHMKLPPFRPNYGFSWKKALPNWPRPTKRGVWPMVADSNDNLLLLSNHKRSGRAVWSSKVDPLKPDKTANQKFGVPAETTYFRGDEVAPTKGKRSMDPTFWDRKSSPDATKTEVSYKEMKPNQWNYVAPPVSINHCGWGTTAYDEKTGQFLHWGGGHSEYKGSNVFHFSTNTGLWSGSMRPDWPIEWSGGFLCAIERGFRRGIQPPVHVYQSIDFDPPSGKMICIKGGIVYTYDVAKREWDENFTKAPFPSRSVMKISLETTPKGVVCWATNGTLWRYEMNHWKKLPIAGGKKFSTPWCDGSGFTYDAQKDCLWLAAGRKQGVTKYDLKTGATEKLTLEIPKVLGRFPLWRESVVIPDTNLILLMRNFKAPDGKFKNIVLDVEKKKYFWAELPYMANGKLKKGRRGRAVPGFSWNSALRFDMKRKLVWLHSPVSFYVLKFDKSKIKLEEVK